MGAVHGLLSGKERWRYLQKLDTKNSLLPLDSFVDGEGNALDFIADETTGVEETVMHTMMLDRLDAALHLLSDYEQALIRAIVFDNIFTKEISRMENVDQSTVNRHKLKIMAKLRKIMKVEFKMQSPPLIFAFENQGTLLLLWNF